MGLEADLSELVARTSDILARQNDWADAALLLETGTLDDPLSFNATGGKDGALGYYPVRNLDGQTVYKPCRARERANVQAQLANTLTDAELHDAPIADEVTIMLRVPVATEPAEQVAPAGEATMWVSDPTASQTSPGTWFATNGGARIWRPSGVGAQDLAAVMREMVRYTAYSSQLAGIAAFASIAAAQAAVIPADTTRIFVRDGDRYLTFLPADEGDAELTTDAGGAPRYWLRGHDAEITVDANGTLIRHADGTQVAIKTLTIPSVNSAWGNVFTSAATDWPAVTKPFKAGTPVTRTVTAANAVMCGVLMGGSQFMLWRPAGTSSEAVVTVEQRGRWR